MVKCSVSHQYLLGKYVLFILFSIQFSNDSATTVSKVYLLFSTWTLAAVDFPL